LHDQIKDSSKIHYENKQYYNAFIEAMKRYKNQVKAKSCTTQSEDLSIMTDSFGKDKTLITTNGFIRPNGVPFDPKTIENIEEGQKFLSMGIVTGGRNVVTHEEINDLQESKLFTEKDCLDLLSLLSHLFKRLDESSKK
jgi:uncharacterized protein (TIGR02391 family)